MLKFIKLDAISPAVLKWILNNPLTVDEDPWNNRNVVLEKDTGDTMDIWATTKVYRKCEQNEHLELATKVDNGNL